MARRLPLRLGIAGALALGSGCYAGETGQDSAASDGTGTVGSGDPSGGPGGSGDPTTSDPTTGGEEENKFAPGTPVFPRLTFQQYRNAIDQLLGPDLPKPPLEPDTNPYLFFTIGAASTFISELGVQQYEEAGDAIARAVFTDPARRDPLVGCVPTAPGDACVQGFLGTFGRRAYRRPLTPDELARWTAVSTNLAAGDPWLGLQHAVAGILQSVHFLYRVELGEPDPNDGTRLRYTNYEMASRLSFLLWNAPPDDALLAAAEAGDLVTEAGILAEAERLLADPRARLAIQDFFAQFLDLGRLDGLTRDVALYPQWTPTMAESMRTEIQLLIDDLVFRNDDDVRQIFSTRRTFVNAELANLYGITAEGASPITFVPTELPKDGPRAGILTLGGFLAMNAHETLTSPTLRGKYVRERVLCEIVPPPPGDVDTNLDEGQEMDAKTLREKLEQHREDPLCAGCHAFIDPPGFLFENFDSIGAFRTEDNGWPIDASGDLDGKPLANARELADRLTDDPRVGKCMVTQLYRHATGRLNQLVEKPGLDDLIERFDKSGHRFRQLLLDLAVSEAFRTVSEETDA